MRPKLMPPKWFNTGQSKKDIGKRMEETTILELEFQNHRVLFGNSPLKYTCWQPFCLPNASEKEWPMTSHIKMVEIRNAPTLKSCFGQGKTAKSWRHSSIGGEACPGRPFVQSFRATASCWWAKWALLGSLVGDMGQMARNFPVGCVCLCVLDCTR